MFLSLALATASLGVAAKLTIHYDQPTVTVSPTLYGVFFEEINYAGDGGLYAELVRNGRFEDSDKPDHWSPVGGAELTLETTKGPNAGHRLRITGRPGAGAFNDGFFGMAVRQGESYRLVLTPAGKVGTTYEAFLESHDGQRISNIASGPADSQPEESVLKASVTDNHARLVIRQSDSGSLDVSSVSLMPTKTWKGRPNGMRPDLAEMLDGLHPAFMRFPGGCWVEGDVCATAYRWKNTIGPVDQRATVVNLWGYKSGNGLGFHEYLQICEDLGAQPLFVINCGMSHHETVPMGKMDEYVQDALDAIEYANGDVSTKWGAIRAKNGHPKPFGLKYMEIGNENGGPAYAERYPLFVKAIRAKYPEMHLIADVWGGIPSTAPVEIVDEHYYSSPEFFMQNADRYDSYDRKGPKVYVGEYAVTQGCGNGNLAGALGEAAFMTGMERNSDVVVMASYAPLYANVNGKGWNPDLIYFDSSRVCGTPSYYVQQMFSRNRADEVVKSEMTGLNARHGSFPGGGVGVGTWRTQADFKDIQLTEGNEVVFQSKDGQGLTSESGEWKSVDGAYRQSSNVEGARAWFGSGNLSNYTLRLKARKVSGDEGFLITVGRRDSKNYLWWNIGGWGNTLGAIENAVDGAKSLIGKQVASQVETGRWYDVMVQYQADHITCTLDGKVVYSEDFPTQKPLYWVAGRSSDGSGIVKVVNVSDQDMAVDVSCESASFKHVSIETLTSANLTDENTLEDPLKVAPRASQEHVTNGTLSHVFPAHSVTVLRLTR